VKGLFKKWGDFVEKSKQRAIEEETLETALEILQLRRGKKPHQAIEDSWSDTPGDMKLRVAKFLIDLMAGVPIKMEDKVYQRERLVTPEAEHVLRRRLGRIPTQDLKVDDIIPGIVSKAKLEEVVSKMR